ncbi:MAG: nuclear transport factor 2 family protein [Sphingobium sp.]
MKEGDALSDLERLVALEDIQTLRARLARALDNQQWDKARTLMTRDARTLFWDDSGSGLTPWGKPVELESPDALIDFTSRIFMQGRIVHMAAMPEIEFESADRARGVWCVAAYSDFGTGTGLGYDETIEDYVRIDGQWLVQNITVRVQALL